jgi:arylsulfatase A
MKQTNEELRPSDVRAGLCVDDYSAAGGIRHRIGSRASFLVLGVFLCAPITWASDLPNIVYILADDLGYGDVQCLNPEGKILTPNIDRLAAQGMVFTDAHSSSAVCTPTRYGILTGRYNWRSRLKNGVLGGFSPPLIERDRLTVAAFLDAGGYNTACVGKWHLGFNWQLKDGGVADDKGNYGALYERAWDVDYSLPILNGPLAVGFDYFFGISASLDMPPYVFIEDDQATEIPTTTKKFLREGPAGARFEGIDVLPQITQKTVEFISMKVAAAKTGTPFFIYMPLNSPHTPILPSPEWQGRSGLNAYADFVMQTDDTVGLVMAALERGGVVENTLIIFTSDNGCSPQANYAELAAKDHDPSHVFRGHKADIFEGGHRIPFIASWPARVKAGTTSQQLICLTDLFATAAEILGKPVPPDAAVDSVSILPALEGRDHGPLREAVVHHSINGSFSIRQGRWKLELCPDSGGWSVPRPNSDAAKKLPTVQLYDLSVDIGETKNLESEHPDLVELMTKLLQEYVADGRSTPGSVQSNNGDVQIRR